MKIYLPDGNVKELDNNANLMDLAKAISNSLAKKVIAGDVNGEIKDTTHTLKDGDKVNLITEDDNNIVALEVLRHSTAHLMAQAVQALYKDAKVTIGPVIENGFFYDFDLDTPFTNDDLQKIEKEMHRIASQALAITRSELSAKEAVDKFTKEHEPYKVEIINDLGESTVSLYTQGGFTDLCRGPHLPTTSKIKHFKLTNVAGAYWRGDEKNKMLQRIYGTAFFTEEALKHHLEMLEEAKRRDHRVLGKQLELFMVDDEIGAGLPVFLPRGGMLRLQLENFIREENRKRGYEFVYGPILMKQDVWQTSGHYDNYRENMYFTSIEDVNYGIKPMNCAAHVKIFGNKTRSYRDLPIRLFELGTVHRHERTGALHGLMRARGFTQDDAHIFCRPDQLVDEITNVLAFNDHVLKVFGFDYIIKIATRPEKAIGSSEVWEKSTDALKKGCENYGVPYVIAEGDGAFYGPKIEVHVKDAIGRTWQVGTVQVDFNLPERFGISYVGDDGNKQDVIMIHRALYGSLERFIGILIEHLAGSFPVWVAPTQVIIMNITGEVSEYCKEICKTLEDKGFRIELDLRNEKIGHKIREAQLMKIPHMLVIGAEEKDKRVVTVRTLNGDNHTLTLDEYTKKLNELVTSRALNSWG